MGRLIYTAIASLDGYVADRDGSFDWSMPDEEVHAAANALEHSIGTHLLGRRLYEVLAVWDDVPTDSGPTVIRDYARQWQATDKIVYSRTLNGVSAARTRLERGFDVAAVEALKASSDADIGIGGPELAGLAILAGLVDEYHVLLSPIVVGGGRSWLPADVRVPLDLAGVHRFGNGVVHLHYRPSA